MLISYARIRLFNVYDDDGTINLPHGSSFTFSNKSNQAVHPQSTWVIASEDAELTSYMSVGNNPVSLVPNIFSPHKE